MMTHPSTVAAPCPPAGLLDYLAEWLEYQRWRLRLPGVQLAVLEGGQVVSSCAVGIADVELGMPLTAEHRMRVASHSKMFTATAVLQLVESGRLGLDDSLAVHLPDLVRPGSSLAGATIRELLSHGSGLVRDGSDSDYWQLRTPFPDREQVIRVVRQDGAVFGPGERFKYSNIGYGVLGMVIEAASGQPFAEYLVENVIARLGLQHTTVDLDAASEPLCATGYSAMAVTDQRHPLPHSRANALAPATGVTSTAEDLCRFLTAHLPGDERLLTEPAKAVLHREFWPRAGYGLGFVTDRSGRGTAFGHSGGYPGFASYSVADPATSRAVSVVCNATDAPAAALAHGVLSLLELGDVDGEPVPGDSAPLRAAEDAAGRYVGTSALLDLMVVAGRVLALDPRAEVPGEDVEELEPLGDDCFLVSRGSGFRGLGETVRLGRAADGAVVSIRARGGRTMERVRSFGQRPAARLRTE